MAQTVSGGRLTGVGRPGRRRWLPLALAGFVGLVLVAVMPVRRVTAAPSSPPPSAVNLQGEGAWDFYRDLTGWENDLFGTNGLINLKYAADGGFRGREDFINGFLKGGPDFVISGVPFTSDELARFPNKGNGDLISAPVAVATMGMAFSLPQTLSKFQFLAFTADGGVAPYTGPLAVPPNNLAAMLFQVATSNEPWAPWGGPADAWGDPAIAIASGFPVGSDPTLPHLEAGLRTGGGFGPDALSYPVWRSDPSETDYFLQQYVMLAAPQVWGEVTQVAQHAHVALEPVSEQLPFAAFSSVPLAKNGAEQQAVDLILSNEIYDLTTTGAIVPVPPGALLQQRAFKIDPSVGPIFVNKQRSLQYLLVQNATGHYVAPTPATIDAAVNAGGDSPLYALTNPVDGAYPLVWTDRMYVPAHGLSASNTEALATVIRYLATGGQKATAAEGDGQLSAAQVTEALSAANQVVLSNCTGNGKQVVSSSDPGPYGQELTGLKGIGAMLHCTQSPAPTTATTLAGSATSGGISQPLGLPSASNDSTAGFGSPDAGTSASSGNASTQTATAAPGGGTPTARSPSQSAAPATRRRSGALAAVRLPLPLPWDGQGGFDRFTAILAGALLFFLARKPVRWLLGVLRS
jgi:hypothetical protein